MLTDKDFKFFHNHNFNTKKIINRICRNALYSEMYLTIYDYISVSSALYHLPEGLSLNSLYLGREGSAEMSLALFLTLDRG